MDLRWLVSRALVAGLCASAPSPAAVAVGRGSGFAAEVAESAQRLSTMDLPAPARAEVDHLRRLARDAGA